MLATVLNIHAEQQKRIQRCPLSVADAISEQHRELKSVCINGRERMCGQIHL